MRGRMENNMTLHINNAVLHQALQYADAKGVNLSQIVETFLLNLVYANKKENLKNFPISDKVKSLATRIRQDVQDVDWEKEKREYFAQKYGL